MTKTQPDPGGKLLHRLMDSLEKNARIHNVWRCRLDWGCLPQGERTCGYENGPHQGMPAWKDLEQKLSAASVEDAINMLGDPRLQLAVAVFNNQKLQDHTPTDG